MGTPVRPLPRVTGRWPRWIRAGLALSVALTSSLTASAQPNPSARAAPRHYVPVLDVSYLDIGSATLPGEDGRPDLHVDSDVLRIAATVGHFFESTRTVVAGELAYELNQVWLRRLDEATESVAFHGTLGRLALLQAIGDGWGTMGFVRAGVSSDFEGLSWSDLRMSMGAAATYRFSESLRIALGGLYTNAFFGEMVLPLVHVRYQRWPYRFNIIVPRGADGWYAPLPWLELGLQVHTRPLRHGIHGGATLGEEYANLNVLAGMAARAYVLHGAYVAAGGGYAFRYYRVIEAQQSIYERKSFQGVYGALALGYML